MRRPEGFDVSTVLAPLFASLLSSPDPASTLMEFIQSGAMWDRLMPSADSVSCPEVAGLDGLLFSRRGPTQGQGVGPGRRSHGVVEDTPCLWVTWVLGECKTMGRPVPQSITIDDLQVSLVAADLTYGLRYYFVCPGCFRRTECLYRAQGEWACRRCHRLLYVSQVTRQDSPDRRLRAMLDRDALTARPGRRYVRIDTAPKRRGRRHRNFLDGLRDTVVAEKIARVLERISYGLESEPPPL